MLSLRQTVTGLSACVALVRSGSSDKQGQKEGIAAVMRDMTSCFEEIRS
jgi:hypothetical protein